jgi:hypothetical protein
LTVSNERAHGACLATRIGIVTRNPEPLVPVVVCLLAGLLVGAHAKDFNNARVRPLDPSLKAVLETGRHLSPTLRALIDRLERGDVIVYLQYAQRRAGVQGRLHFLSAAAGLRYVLVELSRELDAPRLIAIAGHELQHAVEILEQPEIVDHASFGVAYERAAFKRRDFAGGGVGFDTAAAVVAGRQVWREVAGSTAILGTR